MQSVAVNILEYKQEITNLLVLMLPKLAKGFSTQRGMIFGFGPEAHTDPVTFKISAASEEEMDKLNIASVHNLKKKDP